MLHSQILVEWCMHQDPEYQPLGHEARGSEMIEWTFLHQNQEEAEHKKVLVMIQHLLLDDEMPMNNEAPGQLMTECYNIDHLMLVELGHNVI